MASLDDLFSRAKAGDRDAGLALIRRSVGDKNDWRWSSNRWEAAHALMESGDHTGKIVLTL